MSSDASAPSAEKLECIATGATSSESAFDQLTALAVESASVAHRAFSIPIASGPAAHHWSAFTQVRETCTAGIGIHSRAGVGSGWWGQ